jgi:NAD(P)H-dependent flavin oxidoreductase YrpB (nitropropane dioxygenase family)
MGSRWPCAWKSRNDAAHSRSGRCGRASSSLCSGGIADGRGLAAALALGASGAWIGTRFLASNEVPIHPHYRERVLQATEDDTVYLDELFDIGWPKAPHRVLRNSTVAAWEAAGRPATGQRPGEGDVVATSKSRGPIVRYRPATPAADAEGDIDAMALYAGQSVALVHKDTTRSGDRARDR